jgi:hypothetical protein
MAGSRYEFRSTWHLGAAPDDVYAVLERLPDYPLWWPQVRRVTLVNDHAYEVVCRSSLPYELQFTTEQAVRDPAARVLEARMAGDLEGFSRWTIASDAAAGTTATFDEQVVANKTLLRRLEVVARPAFKANHSRMMRDGERGLRTYLAGYRARLD